MISIPIISLTVRPPEAEGEENQGAPVEPGDDEREGRSRGPVAKSQETQDIEGVFVVRDGIAYFTPVEIGITGQEYFEVISGVQVGDTVVSGPYQLIRELNNEDPVQRLEEGTDGEAGRGPGNLT